MIWKIFIKIEKWHLYLGDAGLARNLALECISNSDKGSQQATKLSLEAIKVKIGDGNQTRDFVYVGDVAKANIMALNWKNEVVNIGTGKETSVNELFNIIKNEIGFKGNAIYDKPREGEIYRIYLDIKKAKSLGWKPEVDLKEGIKRVVDWMKTIRA